MKKKLLTILFGSMLVLAACGGGDADESEGNGGADNGADETAHGEELYLQNCSQCHGNDLQGGTGPSLEDVGSEYDTGEIVTIIQEGLPAMPAINMDDDDAQAIADWLVEQ